MPYKNTPEGREKRKEVALRWYRKSAAKKKEGRIAICKYCGNPFPQSHGRIELCSEPCKRGQINANKKRYRERELDKANRRDYLKRRWREDPAFKLRGLINSTVNQALKRWGGRKRGSLLKFLPYTIPQLQAHLEKFFNNTNGFTWENHGKLWHVDHVIPHTLFKYTSLDSKEFRDCWALSNLKPEFCTVNMEKHCEIGYFGDDGQKRFIA